MDGADVFRARGHRAHCAGWRSRWNQRSIRFCLGSRWTLSCSQDCAAETDEPALLHPKRRTILLQPQPLHRPLNHPRMSASPADPTEIAPNPNSGPPYPRKPPHSLEGMEPATGRANERHRRAPPRDFPGFQSVLRGPSDGSTGSTETGVEPCWRRATASRPPRLASFAGKRPPKEPRAFRKAHGLLLRAIGERLPHADCSEGSQWKQSHAGRTRRAERAENPPRWIRPEDRIGAVRLERRDQAPSGCWVCLDTQKQEERTRARLRRCPAWSNEYSENCSGSILPSRGIARQPIQI